MTELCGLGLAGLTLICHFTPDRQEYLDELMSAGKKVTALTDEQSILIT